MTSSSQEKISYGTIDKEVNPPTTSVDVPLGNNNDEKEVRKKLYEECESTNIGHRYQRRFFEYFSNHSCILFLLSMDLLILSVYYGYGNYAGSVTVSAADALECRSSVLQFVINATDVKDECEGLSRAFDETCSNDYASFTVKDNEKKTNLAAKSSIKENQRARRLLSKRDKSKLHNRWWHTYVTVLMQLYRTYSSRLFVANENMNEKRWKEASAKIEEEYYLADEDMVDEFHKQSKIRSHVGLNSYRSLLEGESNTLASNNAGKDRSSNDSESNDEDDDVGNKEKHVLSPALPTSSEHVRDKILNDAMAINDEITDETIVEVIERLNSTITNQTNAEVSSEAISAATAAFTAVLDSPEFVEARACCASIISVFHDECDLPTEDEYNDKILFVIVCVIALCGMVKSLIRHYKVRWLPEAGGCILVGVIGGLILQALPHIDFAFQNEVFLRIMVPPIVFEAALNIDKKSFGRMTLPITMYAVFGTLFSTILTAAMIYYGTLAFGKWCTHIPFIESLIFGALISSIDPIAVLSILSNIGMNDKDTIYVLIFGESLLNDGVVIVLFETLVKFLDVNLIIDADTVWDGAIHFLVIAFGSLFVGVSCGACATTYFYCMKGIQTPLVEVLMFLCWAFIPYYICDGVEWSGIVSIVSAGFFMDIYVVGGRLKTQSSKKDHHMQSDSYEEAAPQCSLFKTIFSQEGFLSSKAKKHIGFVTEINAALMETVIFSYLGLFLFSSRYHWSLWVPTIAILSCLLSRTIMVFFLTFGVNLMIQIKRWRVTKTCTNKSLSPLNSNYALIDIKMQIVLIFAGLRGAMSFALVEMIPSYDPVTGKGSRFKPELKAMTSASIVFTVFVLGGYTYFLLERLGLGKNKNATDSIELASLLTNNQFTTKKEKKATPKHRTLSKNGRVHSLPNINMNEFCCAQ